MIRCVSIGILSFVLLTSLPIDANSTEREKAQVHFEPFEFSIPEKNEFVYFTLFVVPAKQSNLLDLCKMEPRVRDVVNKTLYGRKDLEKLGLKNPYMVNASEVLKKRINQTLGADWVELAIFVRGAIEVETGPVENPPVPHPLSCKQINFQAKSITNPDDG